MDAGKYKCENWVSVCVGSEGRVPEPEHQPMSPLQFETRTILRYTCLILKVLQNPFAIEAGGETLNII